jgi:hypothetical protein
MMDFRTVVVILVLYFIRPQDWVPGMSGMNIIKPLMVVAFYAMYSRQRGFNFGALFRSPIDWLILAYWFYISFTSPHFSESFKGFFTLVAFYFVTSQALSTPQRLAKYLNIWVACIVVVAGMAVLSMYGLDLTNAHDITYTVPDDPRLVLNTYLLNNPNSLGHTVVLSLPVLFFVFFWRRSMGKWLLGVALMALCAYCVYLTKSKGAFIVGFAVIVGSQFLGKRLLTQLIFLGLAITMSTGILSQLPRMNQLSNARQDEAIMGRIMAWEMARTMTKESKTGIGWREFKAIIKWEEEEIFKATHSAYVQVGADLGVYGMCFYLALLYCGFRVLFFARCNSEEDERSRRILFSLLLGYSLSAWMIDRAYHLEYFLMLGAINSLHRRIGVESGAVEDEDDINEDALMEADAEGVTQPFEIGGGDLVTKNEVETDQEVIVFSKGRKSHRESGISDLGNLDTSEVVEELIEEELTRLRYWRRFGVLDILFSLGLVWVVFKTWDYILENI